MPIKQEDWDAFDAMRQKAKAEGLWFHASYQDIWLSPDELYQMVGRYRWGPDVWTLRNPLEYIEYLLVQSANIDLKIQNFINRMKAEREK